MVPTNRIKGNTEQTWYCDIPQFNVKNGLAEGTDESFYPGEVIFLSDFLFSIIYRSINRNLYGRSVVPTNQFIGNTDRTWCSGIHQFHLKSDLGAATVESLNCGAHTIFVGWFVDVRKKISRKNISSPGNSSFQLYLPQNHFLSETGGCQSITFGLCQLHLIGGHQRLPIRFLVGQSVDDRK